MNTEVKTNISETNTNINTPENTNIELTQTTENVEVLPKQPLFTRIKQSFVKYTKNITKMQWFYMWFYLVFLWILLHPTIVAFELPMLVASVILYVVVKTPFLMLWNKFSKKTQSKELEFAQEFTTKTSRFVKRAVDLLFSFAKWFTVLVVVFSLLAVYFLNINTFKLDKVELTNGKKTIVFQEMQHLATQTFYDNVKNDISNYNKEWYSVFLEWVRVKDPINADKFDSLMWFKFDANTYKWMSKMYWLVAQDTAYLIGWKSKVDWKKIKIADVYIDDIIKSYEDKHENVDVNWKTPIEIWDTSKIFDAVFSENGKIIIKYVSLTEMNVNRIPWFNELLQEKLLWKISEYIISFRNDHLMKEINSESNDKIYINYWMLHFKWVFALLQKQDPNWKIVNTTSREVLPKIPLFN